MIAVVDHELGLAAVDTDVLAGDEPGFFGCQKQHHIGNVQWIADTASRLLQSIRAFIDGILVVDPAGST